MRINHFGNWPTQRTVQTEPNDTRSDMAGIAIAPGSSEGLIYVDGVPLQSGRILPLRQSKYTLEKPRPITKALSDPTDVALDSITNLSVVIFEHAAELGCEVARANGRYLSKTDWQFADALAGPLPGLILRVPFVGRRQAEFILKSTDEVGAPHYQVVGVKYDAGKNELWRYTLKGSTAVALDPNFKTLAFYMGGFDNEENWDVLELYLDDGAGGDPTGHWNALAETIGDIGAR